MYALIGFIIYFFSGLFSGKNITNSMKAEMTAQARVGGVAYAMGSTPSSLVAGIGEASFPTGTPVPTYTPYPTFTPYPTQTPLENWLHGTSVPTQNAFLPSQVNFVFSYYYPDLIAKDPVEYASNCHPANYEYNKQGKVTGCMDTSASGLGWRSWMFGKAADMSYRGGVAVPYYPGQTDAILYPFGSRLRVVSPAPIAGDYLVMDICPACDDYYNSHGVLFLDFLMKGLPAGVTWWDEVQVSEVIYP
jgi:hypothetical protein